MPLTKDEMLRVNQVRLITRCTYYTADLPTSWMTISIMCIHILSTQQSVLWLDVPHIDQNSGSFSELTMYAPPDVPSVKQTF